ncbi:hypothetical protein HUJ04_001993 [Dendroctonus ponderosae]|uniref:Uncharacterized protein n=1 Tax=Dendroctonus ponderosae TaxID=77166 RepID=A0AAR5QF92_DENPD|nr:hypothetical protein HUJ04_001993 [Dendroctonus ponderosae]KAH1009667.1 hypothetical protein HUJ04_001993 [Dendroctonus ponderosae]KAH1009668.1 hypothetical protein HUJ04_001993 [Dendroctonus ponderosae]
MMADQSINEILVQIEAGKFSLAVKALKDKKLDKRIGLRFFHGASKACRILEAECDLDGIEKLCKLLVSYLDSLEGADVTNYLRSLYFIIRLICNRERFADIPRMKTILLPTFLSQGACKSGSESAEVYTSITNLIYNFVSRQGRAKPTVLDSCRLETLEILLQIRKTFNSLNELMDFASVCYKVLLVYKPRNDQVLAFYNILLQVVSSKFHNIPEYLSSIQVSLGPITSSILSDAVLNEQFSFAEQFLDNVESALGQSQEGFQIFKAITSLFPHPDGEMEKRVNKARKIIHDFKSSDKKLFYNLVYLLEAPIQNILLFYKKTGLHNWSEIRLLDVSQFIIDDILSYSMIYPNGCNCGCSVKKNYLGMLEISYTLTFLWDDYIMKIGNAGNDFVLYLAKIFNMLYSVMKKLKEAECQKWKYFYSCLSLNNWNIIVRLFNLNIDYVRRMLLNFLISAFDFDGIQPQFRKLSIYTKAFTIFCEMEVRQKNWLNAMGLCALHCLLYPEASNVIFNNFWIMLKVENKADLEILNQTLISILHSQKKKLGHILDFESLLTKSKEIEVLEYELVRYRKRWTNKISMLATLSHIIEIDDIPKLAEIFVNVYGDGQVQVHLDYLPALTRLKAMFETSLNVDPSSSTLKLALAGVHFYLFKLCCKKTVEKNRTEMEKSMKVQESAKKRKQVEVVPKDADDECDIVSAYSNLRLTKFMEVMQSLNTSLLMIEQLIPTELTPKEIATVAHLLTLIGFDYRLHGDSVKSLNAFHLLLKYSANIENFELCLLGISFLIESADVTEDYVKELIRKGDELAKDKANGGCSKTLATYHLCKSKAYLFDNPNFSYEAWKVADNICSAHEKEVGFPILRAQLHVLLHKLTRSCNFIEGHHYEAPMAYHLHCAHDIIVNYLKGKAFDSYEQGVLLDTIYELANIYSLMRLPRDSRSYAKPAVLLAQKTVLPLKCISFLLLLAHCDLATGNMDHYNVKLIGVDDILSLSQFKSSTLITKECTGGGKEEKVPDDVDECDYLMENLALDFPRFTKQCWPSSPALRVDSFEIPKFVSHVKGCLCFMCQSFVCQDLLLKRFHLILVANMYEQEDQLVEEYAVGFLNLYKKLARKFSGFKTDVSKLFPASLIPKFKDIFSECYFNVLYIYNVHMCSNTSTKSEALEMNNQLIQMLEPKKTQYVHLYHDAHLLTLNCRPSVEDEASKPVRPEAARSEASSVPILLTPPNKIAPISLMVNGIEQISPPKQKRTKCNLFNTKTQSTPSNAIATRILPSRKIKKSAAVKPLIAPKTIDIFTDDSPDAPSSTTSRKRVAKKPVIDVMKPDPTKKSLGSSQSPEPAQSSATGIRTRNQAKKQLKSAETATGLTTTRSTKSTEDRPKDKVVASRKTAESIPVEDNADDSSVIPASPEHDEYAKKKERLKQKLQYSAQKSSTSSTRK